MSDQEQELREAARVALLQWLHYLDGSGLGELETAESWSFDDVLNHAYVVNWRSEEVYEIVEN